LFILLIFDVKTPGIICWKMCASATMASLKFLLQDPLQQAASINTTTISNKLNLFQQTNRSLQHLLEII